MYKINLIRKIPLVKIQILLCSVPDRMYVSQIPGPHPVAKVLINAAPSMPALVSGLWAVLAWFHD